MAIQVLTQRYDNSRSGANLQEAALSPATVGPGKFGKLFQIPVDGHVYAQPLYVPGLHFGNRGTLNALFVATMRNQVTAWDADERAAWIWEARLGPPVKLPDDNIGPPHYRDISGWIGIVSTPVISPDLDVIYVVAMTHENGQYRHRLHALRLLDGRDTVPPVTIQGSVPGNGDGSKNERITFTSNRQNQRPGLLLANGTIYVAFASYGDANPYHGWVFGFDAKTLQQRPDIYNTTRYGGRGGIWMAGQGPAADTAGGVYAITGNGTFAQSAIANKVIPDVPGGARAFGHPALAATDDQLVVAWRGTDFRNHLNVMTTTDGRVFRGKTTLDDNTLDGPALAFGARLLFLAFTGTDGRLNVSQSSDMEHFPGKQILEERSGSGPALAFGDGRLFLAWTGNDGYLNINIAQPTDGFQFHSRNKVTLREKSKTSPALLHDGSSLFLLWSGTDGSLNILESTDGRNVKRTWLLKETSDYHPALARRGQLHLTWMGRNTAHNMNHLFGDTPGGLGGKDRYDDPTRAAPALAVLGKRLFLSWTGTDDAQHINVAEIVDVPQLGDAFVKLTPDLGLADWFSPWNTRDLNASDNDLGSGGTLVLPGAGVIVGGGKEGKLYVLDPNNLGHFCDTCRDPAGDTQIIQWWQATGVEHNGQSPPAGSHHIHGSPIFWHSAGHGSRIYVWGEADWLRAYEFHPVTNTFDTEPVDISDVTTPARSMPGGILTVSADGDKDATGIIWACHPISDNANEAVVPGLMRAIAATNLKSELWNSHWHKDDELGNCAKFTPPTVANGKVYVATFSDKICVYGPKAPA